VTVFFTSDTHFGDHRVLNLHPRPFASVAEMDEALIANWNTAVRPDDEVWHLGDFALTAPRAAAVLARLNGRKHLVVGNNDRAPHDQSGWASVQPYAELTLDGVLLVLCHYPFRSWNGQHRGAVNLHGHSHGRLALLPRQHDVGVDVRGYRPVTLAELLPPARKAAQKLRGAGATTKGAAGVA
jgi:calcineurin-like phosphoesterase family protein